MQERKYEVTILNYKDIKDKINVPRFQRNLIWPKKNKQELINSIKKGLPIGSLLLAENKDGMYSVVDGLQRISSIKDFEKNRFAYINEEEVNEEDIFSVIECSTYSKEQFKEMPLYFREENSEKIRKIIIEKTKNILGETINELSWDITKELKKQIDILKITEDSILQPKVHDIITKIHNILDLNKLAIPAIIFRGDDNELANVFEKLNSQGVTLSKYDIFSAQWQETEVKVGKDEDILSIVIDKYEKSIEASGFEIHDFDPLEIKQTGKINLFEYAYSISKLIIRHGGTLFKHSDVNKVDSIGFTVLAGIFGIKNSEMATLKTAFFKNKVDYVDVKDKLIKVTKLVEKRLKDWINIEEAGSGWNFYASEMQIASYIVSLFKLHYEINIESETLISIQKKNGKKIEDVLKNLHVHYLYDVIRGYWAGSGDSKLDDIINFSDNNPCKYEKSVAKTSFESAIIEWLDEENKSSRRETIQSQIKLFLNYLFLGITKKSVGNKMDMSKLDFDHIIPKSQLLRYLPDKTYPVSSPCNLILLPSYENRSKREKTLYEHEAHKLNLIRIDEDLVKAFLYPTRNELNWSNSKEEFTQDNYQIFLDNRKKFLANKILEVLF